jgi:hypothetical protein
MLNNIVDFHSKTKGLTIEVLYFFIRIKLTKARTTNIKLSLYTPLANDLHELMFPPYD